jgi:uncharacterized tellurite resistance protein B-like protein
MKEEAKKQLKPISINHIKETLKKVAPDVFDKMIISENQSIKRCNFIYVKLKYQKVERAFEKIKFPLYNSLKSSFSEIEGGSTKLGEKAKMPSEIIFEILRDSYSKTGQAILDVDVNAPFEFPVDAELGEISLRQSKYFFPDLTFQETCNQCYGHKYVNCNDDTCNGRHKWACTTCNGHGVLSCNTCGGKKQLDCPKCKGSSHVKCKRCGGDGKVNDGILAKTVFSIIVKEKICGDCVGKGYVQCTECKNGKVACRDCGGRGRVICPECDSQGTITCFNCHGDKEKHGKMNCPQCQTEGSTGEIVYVKTNVSSHEVDKFILEGPQLQVAENQLKSHIIPEQKMELIYKKQNNELVENYDEHTRIYARDIEKELGLYKGDMPLLTKEEIYYQIFACVELSYKHMLTNTTHEFTIVDFWNNPEIIYHSEPELLKKNIGNTRKILGDLFGKLFKTKGYKTKKDLWNEIILLIHLMKADGVIKDQEKVSLSGMIAGLNDFTSSEKQKLFNFINASTLPELTKADVTFSTKNREQEVLTKLTDLANSDGEMAESEKVLIDKIKKLIETDIVKETEKEPEKQIEPVG